MERRGGLPSSSSTSWFPHAMQSHMWKKELGGAFYHLLAMTGGEPGAVWTGKVMGPWRKSISLNPWNLLEEAGFLGRGLTSTVRTTPQVNCPAAWNHSLHQILRKKFVKWKNKSRAWEDHFPWKFPGEDHTTSSCCLAMLPGLKNHQELPVPQFRASLVLAHIQGVFRGIHPSHTKTRVTCGSPHSHLFIKDNLTSGEDGLQHAAELT